MASACPSATLALVPEAVTVVENAPVQVVLVGECDVSMATAPESKPAMDASMEAAADLDLDDLSASSPLLAEVRD